MEKHLLFYEKQRFRKWWHWLINLMLMTIIAYQILANYAYFSSADLVALSAVFIIIFTLSFIIKLETKIDQLGIRFRFFPFHLHYNYIPWKNIDKVYVRKYSPLSEYGGWGYRLGLLGKGKAYNISGKIGIQIVFKNQKKLLIGTQKGNEVRRLLDEIKP